MYYELMWFVGISTVFERPMAIAQHQRQANFQQHLKPTYNACFHSAWPPSISSHINDQISRNVWVCFHMHTWNHATIIIATNFLKRKNAFAVSAVNKSYQPCESSCFFVHFANHYKKFQSSGKQSRRRSAVPIEPSLRAMVTCTFPLKLEATEILDTNNMATICQ